MSEVLIEFDDPLVDPSFDRRDFMVPVFHGADGVEHRPGVLHHHESLIHEALEEHLPNATPFERQECREQLRWLVARKLKSFAKYRRPIMALQPR